ncbi:PmoA family protein [Alienimonas chondri]|uniref:Methane oxygenase PmoA n=1 Tax=Alienimonas chondri TaxID=2681879 RepID=A0ABX1VIB3_9PLAN|nr:PmoA family protein [Alienimonas chondri]NNJ27245.1 hypothetical protein [Alienimonas chondri]
MNPALTIACVLLGAPPAVPAAADSSGDYVQLEPLPGGRVSFRVNGEERTVWHPGAAAGRAHFYPLNAPADGGSLVRMGHPGAPNHDHHRGIWFAHHDVGGLDFWSVDPPTTIRQTEWLAIESGLSEGRFACRLGWFGPTGEAVMTQDLSVALRPLSEGDYELELNVALRPAGEEPLTLGQTNFGMLGVRFAETVSEHFGDGRLTDAAGRTAEQAIFGEPNPWMDYSGPIPAGQGENFRFVPAGVTLFDHPTNPGAPVRWHVRADGWMGPSVCREAPRQVTAEQPLRLRYLLHVHAGDYEGAIAKARAAAFADRPPLNVRKSSRPHRAYEFFRADPTALPAGPAPE